MKYLLTIFCLILCSCFPEKEPYGNQLLPSSSSNSFDVDIRVDKEKFKSEWNLWKSKDIKNYSFKLKGDASPMTDAYEVAIIVKNGIMDSFEYIGKKPNMEPEYTSISDMYQKIYNEIMDYENQELENCHLVVQYEMEYDQESHYITNFEASYGASDCEGLGHLKATVSDFLQN